MRSAALFVVLAALVLMSSSEAKWSPCVCTRQLEPTCGTDGVTYSNPCVLECAATSGRSQLGKALKVLKAGPCEDGNNNFLLH